jgi:hypothetical protein
MFLACKTGRVVVVVVVGCIGPCEVTLRTFKILSEMENTWRDWGEFHDGKLIQHSSGYVLYLRMGAALV